MVSRRNFIKQAGAFTLALPFGLAAAGRSYAGALKPSCVIIGAGLAGLAAAYKLKEAGWIVTVLESRERTGGRVFTHRMERNPTMTCELGAEWVGASHDRVRALCRDFSIELRDHRFETALLRDGRIVGPDAWRYSDAAVAAFEKFRAEYARYGRKEELRLDSYDWWTWLQKIGFTQDDLRLRDLFDSTDFGESIRHVSAYAAAAEYFESSPANEMDFKMEGGNSRLVEELAKRVGAENIRTGKAVTEIRQRAGAVSVTAAGERFTADACICTVPARVLNAIRFDPPLPASHAAAADQLQYARIIKSSVLYSERFWREDDYSLVTDRTSHYYFHSTRGQRDGLAGGRGTAEQGIFTSYAIGEKADVLAAQSEAQRMAIIAGDLRPLDERAPSLALGIASYAWQRDPHTLGAYALYRPGQWFTTRPALARPHGKVLFAGEHLADWQGFMEGAIVTGEAAAKALAER